MRKRKKLISVLLSGMMLVSLIQPVSFGENIGEQNAETLFETYTGRYIVKYKENQSSSLNQESVDSAFEKSKQIKQEKINEVSEQKGEEELKEAQRILSSNRGKNNTEDAQIINTLDIDDTKDTYDVIQLNESVDSETFARELEKEANGSIEYIQPDYMMKLQSEETENTSAPSDNASAPAGEVELPPITPEPENTNPVTVALIDTGIDTAHPDLAQHMVQGYDFYNNSPDVSAKSNSLVDVHGTHLAGVITQTAPNAKIMPLKVFENGKAYTSDIIKAIEYAKEQGAEIVNCSWGSSDNNQALKDAMTDSGLLFVCAAGNYGRNVDETPVYPGTFDLENIINVASVNDDLGLSYFSNYGVNSVDIAAKGRDIESTYPGGEYGTQSGTSMAAAVVSGAAAGYASVYSTENIKEALISSSDKISGLAEKTLNGNMLNVDNLYWHKQGQTLDIQAVDEFSIERTPEENLELFASYNNLEVYATIEHPVFLKGNGSVWTLDEAGNPQQIKGLKNIIKLYANGGMFIAIDSLRQAYAYDFFNHENPGTVINTGLKNVVDVLNSNTYFLALTQDGHVWGWGQNENGQAGGDVEDGYFDYNSGIWISEGFEDVYNPIMIGVSIAEPGYGTPLSNIKKIYTDGGVSYAVDNNNTLYAWGWLGRPTPMPEIVDENISFISPQKNGLMKIKTNGSVEYNGVIQTEIPNDVVKLYNDVILFSDGHFNIISADGDTLNFLGGELSDVKDIAASPNDYNKFYAVIKNDDTVWAWGDNTYHSISDSSAAYFSNPIQLFKGEKPSLEEKVIINEQYNNFGNPAYKADQSKLEEMGWKEGKYYGKGELSADSGQLIIKKTSPQDNSTDLVYDVTKTFTQRTDNWRNDPRVSVWTNNFKGKYSVEIKGSFNQARGQVYYDVMGATNTGNEAVVARYKVDPGTSGGFHVYNYMLNGGGTKNYTMWKNPTKNRVIRTTLDCESAAFQTFEDNSYMPSATTVKDAFPNDTFNMTDWGKRNPSEYISGIKISAQSKEAVNSKIAMLDYVKLIEHEKANDPVEYAVNMLSMSDLTDTPEAVTKNLRALPTYQSGADITWTSSRPDILTDEGKLADDPLFDTDIIMTAKITNPQDQFTKYMDFYLTVSPRSGFQEIYSGNAVGTPSSADNEGTKTFEQLPKWNFSYPGISNGTDGEIHTGQVLIKDGYLIFKKISDRQTVNYKDCVVGVRPLSNIKENPLVKSANIGFTAKANGTGTMRFAPLTVDGVPALTLILDASVKAIDVTYGEKTESETVEVKQRINIDPTVEHTYELLMNGNNTFVLKIDGNVIQSVNNTNVRNILPQAESNPVLSQMKVWITNVTFKDTEVGYLKRFSVTKGRTPAFLKTTLNMTVRENAVQTFAMGGPKPDGAFEIAFDPLFLECAPIHAIKGITVDEISTGRVRVTYTDKSSNPFSSVLCRLNFKGKQNGNTAIKIYEDGEVE